MKKFDSTEEDDAARERLYLVLGETAVALDRIRETTGPAEACVVIAYDLCNKLCEFIEKAGFSIETAENLSDAIHEAFPNLKELGGRGRLH